MGSGRPVYAVVTALHHEVAPAHISLQPPQQPKMKVIT